MVDVGKLPYVGRKLGGKKGDQKFSRVTLMMGLDIKDWSGGLEGYFFNFF